jgi:hypothetical protein
MPKVWKWRKFKIWRHASDLEVRKFRTNRNSIDDNLRDATTPEASEHAILLFYPIRHDVVVPVQ